MTYARLALWPLHEQMAVEVVHTKTPKIRHLEFIGDDCHLSQGVKDKGTMGAHLVLTHIAQLSTTAMRD